MMGFLDVAGRIFRAELRLEAGFVRKEAVMLRQCHSKWQLTQRKFDYFSCILLIAKHLLYNHTFPEVLLNHPKLFFPATQEEHSHKSYSSAQIHICALTV